MKVLRIDPKKPDKSSILLAATALKEGRILVYPTDTVYGIGCSHHSEKVMEVFRIKKRPLNRPLSIACSDMDMVKEYTHITPKEESFIRENILKPYTFIVEKKRSIPDIVTSGGDTVGVRIPNHLVVKKVIEIAGVPIITTSANVSGEPYPASFEEISAGILSNADLAIDSGRCRIGKPSKVVDLKSGRVLRPT
ncbi:MAG: threonylcarbamoyl-AMP synthase [Candidatus Altiarchaeota archaeon]|nr:threonylcarbamoyl-AMP synthase [Candidatus Altiarchaeota archaeon]